MTVAADLHLLSEDDRIRLIGASVMGKAKRSDTLSDMEPSAGQPVMNAFIVENNAKADRYVQKLRAMFPGLRVVDRMPGPTPNTILVRIAGPLR